MSTVMYQTMPPLSPDEYAQLEASCLEHGIQVPIIVDENGAVIDGHHRQKIAQEHGLYLPKETRDTLSDAEKTRLSISLNIDRRQLTREQRREIIARSIKAEPELTDREHARRTGASPTTVGSVRADLVDGGEVSNLDTRRDPRGYEQPASRPVVTVTTKTEEVESFDPSTGEIVDVPATRAEPPKPRRSSLVDEAYAVERALFKPLTKLREITRDDRFNKNKANIQDALRPVADLAHEILADLFDNQSQED